MRERPQATSDLAVTGWGMVCSLGLDAVRVLLAPTEEA
jgi:hypothetical protein